MIDTQAIRNKILDLALRGKLTEQLPEDGTAEELYQRIQKERENVLNTRKGREDKNIKPYDEETPYELPSTWKWIRLGNIGLFKKGPFGSALTKSMFVPKGKDTVKVYEQQHAIKKNCNLGTYYIKKEYFEEKMTGFEVFPGDVIISCAGTIGETYIMPDTIEHGIINQALMRVTLVPSIDKRFFQLYFDYHLKQNAQNESNGSAINNIPPFEVLKNWYFPLLPITEQKRIIEKIEVTFSFLDTIDALQTQYHDNLAVLKSKLFDAGIQGKLTEQLSEDGTAEELYQQIQQEKQALEKAGKIKKSKPLPPVSDEEKPFDIPENWKWVRIASLGTTTTGGTPSKNHSEYYGGNYPFFKPSDLDRGCHITKASEYLSETGKKESRQLPKGSILVCCIGSIGKCAIIDIDGTANQQINALAPIMCDSDYLLYAIDNDAFKYQLNQGSRATTVSIINKNKFDNCIIPLPPLTEQKRIVAKLNELLQLCERNRESV